MSQQLDAVREVEIWSTDAHDDAQAHKTWSRVAETWADVGRQIRVAELRTNMTEEELKPVRSWPVTRDSQPHILAVSADGLRLTRTSSGQITEYPWNMLNAVSFPTPFSVSFTSAAETVVLGFHAGVIQRELRAVLQDQHIDSELISPVQAPARHEIGADRITTLPNFPGYVVTRAHGVVTELTSNSGWTATTKGNNALDLAMRSLRISAQQLSANAIVGLSATTFAAHGGITNMIGGDAVGVLLLGTAVTIDALPPNELPEQFTQLRTPDDDLAG